MPKSESGRNPAAQILKTGGRGRSGPGIISFIGEVIAELKKVTWPTRPEATRLTILVISISVAIGIILGLIDLGFSRFFEQII